VYFCPAAPAISDNRWDRLTYGNTGYYGPMAAQTRGHQDPWSTGADFPPTTFGRIKKPEQTMMIADVTTARTSTNYPRGWSGMSGYPSPLGPAETTGFHGRHSGGDNVLFVGGNVGYEVNTFPRINLQFNSFTTTSGRGIAPFSWDHGGGF
jgi:hypothetical protein